MSRSAGMKASAYRSLAEQLTATEKADRVRARSKALPLPKLNQDQPAAFFSMGWMDRPSILRPGQSGDRRAGL